MSFPILDQYKTQFPNHSTAIEEFQTLYNKKYSSNNLDYGMNCPWKY